MCGKAMMSYEVCHLNVHRFVCQRDSSGLMTTLGRFDIPIIATIFPGLRKRRATTAFDSMPINTRS